jgi:hypothetical protein
MPAGPPHVPVADPVMRVLVFGGDGRMCDYFVGFHSRASRCASAPAYDNLT